MNTVKSLGRAIVVAAVALLIAATDCAATDCEATPGAQVARAADSESDPMLKAIFAEIACLERSIAELDDQREEARNIAIAAQMHCFRYEQSFDTELERESEKKVLDSTIGMVISHRACTRNKQR